MGRLFSSEMGWGGCQNLSVRRRESPCLTEDDSIAGFSVFAGEAGVDWVLAFSMAFSAVSVRLFVFFLRRSLFFPVFFKEEDLGEGITSTSM